MLRPFGDRQSSIHDFLFRVALCIFSPFTKDIDTPRTMQSVDISSSDERRAASHTLALNMPHECDVFQVLFLVMCPWNFISLFLFLSISDVSVAFCFHNSVYIICFYCKYLQQFYRCEIILCNSKLLHHIVNKYTY